MDPTDPSPKDLRGAAGVAQTLAYVSGLAGVVAGALLYREGDITLAIVLWLVTFTAGALMMVTAALARSMASLLARLTKMDADMQVLLRDRAASGRHEPRRNPAPDADGSPWR